MINLSKDEKDILIHLISEKLSDEFKDSELPYRDDYKKLLINLRDKLKEEQWKNQ